MPPWPASAWKFWVLGSAIEGTLCNACQPKKRGFKQATCGPGFQERDVLCPVFASAPAFSQVLPSLFHLYKAGGCEGEGPADVQPCASSSVGGSSRILPSSQHETHWSGWHFWMCLGTWRMELLQYQHLGTTNITDTLPVKYKTHITIITEHHWTYPSYLSGFLDIGLQNRPLRPGFLYLTLWKPPGMKSKIVSAKTAAGWMKK